MELLLEVLVNNIVSILASFRVNNPILAAQAATSVPVDFTAIATALGPHFSDDTLRNSAAAAVMQERQNQLLAGGALPLQPQAHLPVGQALLPVTLPAAPMLAWQLPGMTGPAFPQAQPTVQPVVVQPSNKFVVATLVISAIALLFLLVFGILWMVKGATEENMVDGVSATATLVKIETDKLALKADAMKVVTDSINTKADALKITTTATGIKADNLKVVTDNLTVKVDDAKLIIDATSQKVDSLHTKADAAKLASDALKSDLANARASLRRAIASKASTADVTAAEARMVLALKASKITVRVEQR